MHASTRRGHGITLLAALFTVYTMAGFLLARRVWSDRDERYRWWLIAAAAVALALAPGMWRSAIQGAVLILAFLLLAAWYVRTVVRGRT